MIQSSTETPFNSYLVPLKDLLTAQEQTIGTKHSQNQAEMLTISKFVFHQVSCANPNHSPEVSDAPTHQCYHMQEPSSGYKGNLPMVNGGQEAEIELRGKKEINFNNSQVELMTVGRTVEKKLFLTVNFLP